MTATPEWARTYAVGSAAELQGLAAALAPHLRPADLLVLSGELGAGKTTFTQGLGRGLSVEDRIISPTFVLVRQHPAADGGPGLVHVDAYRLGNAAAVDDLDLEATMDSNVTVVEWGAGRVEHLSDSWLRVDIVRPLGSTEAASGGPVIDFDDDGEDEVRTVTLSGFGPRWSGRQPALPLD
ncbi:tRNA (adenosine(37)-N6)-threonylcarbamoyltransferase complex ATPase subunit type 1 TsaE [Arthrobacter burdickii]|uniref:tRNA threonylcarbamoyladenosine biosynthesis protein TsaE n=1 Tax=Arthrobacter burdickii TaxID=3035920 RepID=A0ABT8K1B7_9MICC|nr:tRNA (adenosine(37)-N6)-threonylcarbamoyltransferase complex ATPase subunit type 1 TsaE [Arthrobacter burdickii]MDN4610813.1 tRNA (adenosine(37)-N6)-threonylcarbamoyltransferase complex ATPase subunit type 1 TsaE [Arthrobacter burdickii]